MLVFPTYLLGTILLQPVLIAVRHSCSYANPFCGWWQIMMVGRHILIRLLLLSYMLMIIKPAVPVIMDTIAHKYWNESHYSTVHKHNGNAHVHSELKKAANDEKHESPSTKFNAETSDYYLHSGLLLSTATGLLSEQIAHTSYYAAFQRQVYHTEDTDPPDHHQVFKMDMMSVAVYEVLFNLVSQKIFTNQCSF
jgi:hypothetical protein